MFSPPSGPHGARITKYLNKYVRRGNVCQAILENGSGRKLSHNGCTAANFDLPNYGYLLLT
jgi:hypothetical protein